MYHKRVAGILSAFRVSSPNENIYVKKLKSVDPKGEAQALLPLGGLCAGSEALQYFLFTLFYKMWKFDWLWKAFNESLT